MTRLIDLDALPQDWQIEDVIFAPEVDAIPIAHIQRRIEELKPMAAKEKKKQSEAEPEQNGLAEWVLTYLTDPAKLHISVVPAEDIDRLHGISNYETYMTKKVQEQLGREDVRVMVREVKKDPTSKRRAYNARVIFGI